MRDAGDNMNACETSKIRAEGSTFSRRSFEVFGRFENSHGRFEIFGRFEVSKTGHFATGHFTHEKIFPGCIGLMPVITNERIKALFDVGKLQPNTSVLARQLIELLEGFYLLKRKKKLYTRSQLSLSFSLSRWALHPCAKLCFIASSTQLSVAEML